MTSTAGRNLELILRDEGVFNIEGGCYARCAGLDRTKEPDIYDAIRFGTVLENVKFYDSIHREVDFNDTSLTPNTRISFPLEFLPNAKIPGVGGHPKNIIFLTCDANGVLPPVSKLDHAQGMYHFVSGYSSSHPGINHGDNRIHSTFSACYAEPFLLKHPYVYAELLYEKLKKHNVNIWLINTGWIEGKAGNANVDLTLLTTANSNQVHASNHRCHSQRSTGQSRVHRERVLQAEGPERSVRSAI